MTCHLILKSGQSRHQTWYPCDHKYQEYGFDNFLVFDTHCSGPSSYVSYPVWMTASGVKGKTD
jgi:hypothetical protein